MSGYGKDWPNDPADTQVLDIPQPTPEPLHAVVWAELRAHPGRLFAIAMSSVAACVLTMALTSPAASRTPHIYLSTAPRTPTAEPPTTYTPVRTRAPRRVVVAPPSRRPVMRRTVPARPTWTPKPTPRATPSPTSPAPPVSPDPPAEIPMKPPEEVPNG